MKHFVKLVVVMGLFNYGSICGMRVAARTAPKSAAASPAAAAAVPKVKQIPMPVALAAADVTSVDDETPLYCAVGDDNIDELEKHLVAGENPNRRNKGGLDKDATPLCLACLIGNLKVVKVLLNCEGIEINKPNIPHCKDETPLCLASRMGHWQIVQLLLAKGAEQPLKGADERWGMQPMRSYVKTEITPLYLASENGHPDAVKLLLDHNADILCRWPCVDKLPIHIAAENGHLRTVQLLLNGAGDYSKDYANLPIELPNDGEMEDELSQGIYPLHLAARNCQACVVKELLARGACGNVKKINGRTPLHLAARRGYALVVKILLDNGVDFEAKDESGMTALHYAIDEGHVETARLLFVACKDLAIYIQTEYMEYALRNNNIAIIRAFLESFRINWSDLFKVVEEENVAIFNLFFGACENREEFINNSNESGETILYRAAALNHLEAVDRLLSVHGVVVDCLETSNGWTPLHVAAHGSELEIVRLLLANNANPMSLDNEGRTPLHLAASLYPDVVQQLILTGDIDLDAQTKDGKTPLHMAAESNRVDLVMLLLDAGADPTIKDRENKVASQLTECDDLRVIMEEYEKKWYKEDN